jgi:hypothetical protein
VYHHHLGRLAESHAAESGCGKGLFKGNRLGLIQAATKRFKGDSPHADSSATQSKSDVER